MQNPNKKGDLGKIGVVGLHRADGGDGLVSHFMDPATVTCLDERVISLGSMREARAKGARPARIGWASSNSKSDSLGFLGNR